MTKYKSYLALGFLLTSIYGFSCLNGAEEKLSSGTTIYVDREGLVPYGHEYWLDLDGKDIQKLDSLYQVKPDVKYLTEKGIVFIIQKEYQKAIDLYLDIEKQSPNLYATASNLGTTYELIGDNENALKWIAKAIELNPNSHNNSEWIHLNILKIKLGQLPLNSQNLIGTDFGTEAFPKTSLTATQLQDLQNQLYFQLNERRSFVQPKDEIMAQLLFDYANVLFLNNHKKEANEVYNLAIQYGFVEPIIQDRLANSSANTSSNFDIIATFKNNWDAFVIAILVVVIFIFALKKKEQKKKN